MQRWLRLGFICTVVIGVLLLIYAVAGGAASTGFGQFFPALLALNIFTTLVLFCIVLRLCGKLFFRWKAREFGSRMTSRLALTIAAIAIVPCLLLYLVSAQFIGRSIDSWFDARIEHALEEGVTLSSDILENERNRLLFFSRRAALYLNDVPQKQWDKALDKLREDFEANVALIFNSQGVITSSSISPDSQVKVDIPLASELQDSLSRRGFSLLEGESSTPEDPMRIRTIVPVYPERALAENYFLQFSNAVPPKFAQGARGLVEGYRDYQELTLTRNSLQTIYRVSLTLTMLLTLLAAIALAFWFARTMTEPVMQLATGTKKVAEGNLAPIREFAGNDEINALTQSFNSMVAQIAEAQKIAESQRLATERSRAYLASVLSNISAGVLVLDESLCILMANTGANAILAPSRFTPGERLSNIEPKLCEVIADQIRVADTGNFHVDFELSRQPDPSIALFIRGSRLELEGTIGWVVAFDNVSALIDAQKAQAWNEVARRLAHEIKNPLTPIRLAAERLAMKLTDKLNPTDAALLTRATSTIVNQVDAMKKMVNDFRDFAKLPAPTLQSLDLNELIEEMIAFYHSGGVNLTASFGTELPPIQADAAQLRQVLFNLIGNSIEACAEIQAPKIHISTEGISHGEITTAVRMKLEDNGPGFQPSVLAHAFEPYITTKPTGTGLGLPMVKKILEEHKAKITIENITSETGDVLGARINIVFPISKPEL